ncbi:NAD(P)/FAD-dependent oxidoreductase [Algirhabdus cladophorae]|uniref:NAD(P)/FAD-dependent oxidoreductase n=1 Tax=Algirhabdus cladophorae TaxID=3377108 RepID=UPI003B847733
MSQPLQKIVIVGAGFGGLSAAKALSKAPVEITLIDRQNHHLFQPLLYQVATAALTPAEIAVPIRHILRHQKNVHVVMDSVDAVDTSVKCVTTKDGQRFDYDVLILATGARHSYFGKDHWAQHAPGLKTLGDAFDLRERILSAFEQAENLASSDLAAAKAHQCFVVVGAGPTGVEMAGAIAELAHSLARDFRKIDPKHNRILLIEGGPDVLPSLAKKLSKRARRDLESLGVEVLTDTMVRDIHADRVETSDSTIASHTAVWAAGVQASPAAKWLGLDPGRSGHVPVDDTLRPQGHDDVYVIGDTALALQNDKPLPGIAPVAKQMGQYVGRRLAQIAVGHTPKGSFRYKDAGALATIGRNRAVADIFGLKVTGFIGWLLWGAAHVYFLIGFKNRLFVVLNWLWSYITWQRGVRLIMHKP